MTIVKGYQCEAMFVIRPHGLRYEGSVAHPRTGAVGITQGNRHVRGRSMPTENDLRTMSENGAARLEISDLRFQIITEFEQFLALKTAWDSLCDRSANYNFCQSFQWRSAAWTILGYPQSRNLFCLVGCLDGRVVLIWPFLIFWRSVLHPLGSVTTEYSDVLVEDNPDADHWVELAWQQVRATCNSDLIDLPFVRMDSRLHRVIAKERPMIAWGNFVSGVKWDGYQKWENYRCAHPASRQMGAHPQALVFRQ